MEVAPLAATEDITLPSILEQAERVKDVVAYARETMLAPTQRKKPPVFSTAKLMELTGLEKPQVDYRLRRGELPSGRLTPSGARREFSLNEARVWVRESRRNELRPAGATAITIAIGNFKGGVSKTTTAATTHGPTTRTGSIQVWRTSTRPRLTREEIGPRPRSPRMPDCVTGSSGRRENRDLA